MAQELSRQNPPSRRINYNGHARFIRYGAICFGVLIIIILIPFQSIVSAIVNGIHDKTTGMLYRLRRQKTDDSPFEYFTSQNPIFTKRVSTETLNNLLENRRRIIGGTVNNTLIAACRNSTHLQPHAVSSWISVRGVREVLFVHLTTSREDSENAMRIISDVDRLGRVLYVQLVDRDGEKRQADLSSASKRWRRALAFNLGAAIASGTNLVFTDCNSLISADALTSHPLSNGTLYVSLGRDQHLTSNLKFVKVIYIKKKDFLKVNGFDERIDIPGFDMADLVERSSQSNDLRWQTMDDGTSQAAYISGEVALPQQYSADGINMMKDGASFIPEFALYVSAFARDEVPVWDGQLSENVPSILSLQSVILRVLRSQFESVTSHSRKLSMFVPPMHSDFRLWIHVTLRKQLPVSMIDSLSRELRAAVLLKAQRKLLHDHHGVPRELLSVIESVNESNISVGSLPNRTLDGNALHLRSNDHELKIAAYSPIMFDMLWRKSKLLVVNIEADYAMELFRGMAWAISSAIAHGRTLIVVGDLQGTPLVHLLNVTQISTALRREYNVRLDIVGRPQLLNCSVDSYASCWGHDEAIEHEWREHRVTTGVSEIHDDPSKHVLMHIPGRDVVRWDDHEKASIWQRQLEVNAFACITISNLVKSMISQNSEKGWTNVESQTALWITRSSRDAATVKAFSQGYMKKRKLRKNRPTLLFLSDHAEMRSSGDARSNAIRNVAELWIAMQCQRIVFDNEEVPLSWKGTDECMSEWRRIQNASSSRGVVHTRSSDVRATVTFHELKFTADGKSSRV